MPEPAGLAARIGAFGAHLRDPEHVPCPPGLDDRRVAVYRELFFNNLVSLLAGNLPVLSATLGETEFRVLVRDFYARWPARTPLFTEVAEEFLGFLAESGQPAWVAELAHYEWCEMALQLADLDLATLPVDREGDPWTGIPLVSPLAWPLAYRHPVHRIRPGAPIPAAGAQPTCLVILRDLDDAVRFHEIDAATHALLTRLAGNRLATGAETVETLLAEQPDDLRPDLRRAARQVLQQLKDRCIVLGTVPETG